MTAPGLLWVDGGTGQRAYKQLRIPDNWTVHYAKGWGSIGPAHQWVFENYPDASHYGWLADDTVPRTYEWDQKLEAVADNGNISYAYDCFMADEEEALGALKRGAVLSSGICYGGDLVRAVGWLSLPGLVQAGIDTAWTAIAGKLCRCRYVEEVTVEHKHYTRGVRKDEGWSDHSLPHIARDLYFRDQWVSSLDYFDTLERISKLCPQRTTYRYPVTGWTEKETVEQIAQLRHQAAKQAAWLVEQQRRKTVGPPLARLQGAT